MTSKFFGSPKPNPPKKGDKKTPTPQPRPVKTTQVKKTGRGKYKFSKTEPYSLF